MLANQFDCLNWSVKCKDSQNHKKLCKFKMIKCSIDGSNHKLGKMLIIRIFQGMIIFFDIYTYNMKQSITASHKAKMKHLQ